MFKRKCMYCGSSSVGTGCPYGPKGIHVHAQNAGNCIYCGSSSVGQGCPYNPLGNVHVRGIDYNVMVKEALLNGLTTGLLMKRLSEPFTDWSAYKLGIINENGNLIKQPKTFEEKSSFTSADAYIVKLRKLLTDSQIELLNNSIYLSEQKNEYNNADIITEMYSKQYEARSQIELAVDNLFSVINEAYSNGLDQINIEKILIETISIKK